KEHRRDSELPALFEEIDVVDDMPFHLLDRAVGIVAHALLPIAEAGEKLLLRDQTKPPARPDLAELVSHSPLGGVDRPLVLRLEALDDPDRSRTRDPPVGRRGREPRVLTRHGDRPPRLG